MRLFFFFIFSTLISIQTSFAQKKPLDHGVYDSWQSLGERKMSKDGKWIAYTINLQEGDNLLVIQSSDNTYKKIIERGYTSVFSTDNRFLVFKIKPLHAEDREAKIKKKKFDDFPKDSLAIVELGKDEIIKVADVKSFALPESGADWMAYHLHKKPEQPEMSSDEKKNQVDSLQRVIDSLLVNLKETQINQNITEDVEKLSDLVKKMADYNNPVKTVLPVSPGTPLVLKNLKTGQQKIYQNVIAFQFSKNGNGMLIHVSKENAVPSSKALLLYLNTSADHVDTLMDGAADFKNYTISEDGTGVAFLAQKDTNTKATQKLYKLWYYNSNLKSTVMLVDENTIGKELKTTVSENGRIYFSKSGSRLFFNTAPIQVQKKSPVPEIDQVKLDIWHYNDDYLQPQQLSNITTDQRKSYLAMYDFTKNKIIQLASPELTVNTSNEGDGKFFLGLSDAGNRIQMQWNGYSLNDVFALESGAGNKKQILKQLKGRAYVSDGGKYIIWYDDKKRNYFTYNGIKVQNITQKINVPLYNEENDIPNDPSPYGIMRWLKNDEAVFIYDRYDIWKLDPEGIENPVNITGGEGRKNKLTFRFINLKKEENFIDPNERIILTSFNNLTKETGVASLQINEPKAPFPLVTGKFNLKSVSKAEDSNVFIYTKESFIQSPNLYVNNNWKNEIVLTHLNPQQQNYNWGTAELFNWKTFSGQKSTGILYKPENFDSTKKYPVILYFYEKFSDNLHNYIPPQPTGSKINIPFFVSRGYIVMTPDIHFSIGQPAKDAYNYIVSGAKELANKKWIDEKNIGIQGQSWGGIQVAQLVTMTNMFKAAWSGAPVANMTSAYGGIRWESGKSRQFQYEKTQSRIGATLWERPDLYIENSPLFHLPKVNTPLVIMHNDADGAVPWYQGIELFTGLRRLGKKVWLLNYNGEAHNLKQRKNQKDISIRQQQYFDHMLKGEKAPQWIVEGVKATDKGKNLGLEIVKTDDELK